VVADYLTPPRDPGPIWTKGGRPVDGRELKSIAGPDHCNWQHMVCLQVGWPLGTRAKQWQDAHRFLRDPTGTFDCGVQGTLLLHVTLPPDARATGYRNGELELWLSPSDQNSAFLRVGTDVEERPRVDSSVSCR
jgi:hypothetical protein